MQMSDIGFHNGMNWVSFAVLFLLLMISGFFYLTGIEMKSDGGMMIHDYIRAVADKTSR